MCRADFGCAHGMHVWQNDAGEHLHFMAELSMYRHTNVSRMLASKTTLSHTFLQTQRLLQSTDYTAMLHLICCAVIAYVSNRVQTKRAHLSMQT